MTNNAFSLFAWHQVILTLPGDWAPHRLDGGGDGGKGSVEFSDLRRTRLGVQWETLGSVPEDVPGYLASALRLEVGELAAREAFSYGPHTLVYEDDSPPKRDVAVVWFPEARKVLKLIVPLETRDRTLRELLPNISVDTAEERRWRIFDLSLTTPAGWRLQSHRLLAGDHRLTFSLPCSSGSGPDSCVFGVRALHWASVRQIGPAGLALRRMPLTGWLRVSASECKRHYKFSNISPSGLTLTSRRKRRFFWKRSLPGELYTQVLHQPGRDRLVILQSSSRAALDRLGGSFSSPTLPLDPVVSIAIPNA